MRKSVFLLMLVASLVAACASPAMMPSQTAETESGEVFMVALPRIVLTADESGQLGVDGLPLDVLGIGGMLPAVSPDFVAAMQQANIQHLELRHTGDGLAVIVNGMPLPHVAWGDESFKAIGDLLYVLGPQIGVDGEALQKLLTQLAPIVERLGISLALKFPAAADAPEVPFATDEVALAAPQVVEAPPSAVAKFEVKYDDQGVPSIMGISAQDLAALGINAPLALAPAAIQQAQANNIQNLEVRSKGDGLYAYVNGVQLPALAWDEQMLSDAVDVYGRMNNIPPTYLDVIKQFLPMLSRTDVAVMVHLPIAEGQEAIPAKMQ